MRRTRWASILALLLALVLAFGLTGCSAVADQLDLLSGLLRGKTENGTEDEGDTEATRRTRTPRTTEEEETEGPAATDPAPSTEPAGTEPSPGTDPSPEPPKPQNSQLIHINTAYDNKTIPFTEGDWSHLAVKTQFTLFSLGQEHNNDYPQLDAALYYYSRAISDEFLGWADSEVGSVRSGVDPNTAPSPASQMESKGTVVRADTGIVSLVSCIYSYSFPAAHPNVNWVADSFDPATGNRLALTDVVKDRNALLNLVADKLVADYGKDTFYVDVKATLPAMPDTGIVWSADYDAFTVYFDPYVLAPYAEGEFIVRIPYRGNEGLFTDRLLNRPSAFTSIQGDMDALYTDVTGDGVPDTIAVYLDDHGIYDGTYGDVHVIINGTDHNVWTGDSLGRDMYVVHPGDGRSFLYIINAGYNGWDCLVTVNVTNGGATYVKEQHLSIPYIKDGDLVWAWDQNITDPSYFYMSHITDALSTNNAVGIYRAGSDGAPEQISPWFELQSNYRLTLKANLKVQVVNNDGAVIGEKDLVPGDEVILFRTDDSTWVDAFLDDADATRVRIRINTENWPIKLDDGRNADEVFDGMLFAG